MNNRKTPLTKEKSHLRDWILKEGHLRQKWIAERANYDEGELSKFLKHGQTISDDSFRRIVEVCKDVPSYKPKD